MANEITRLFVVTNGEADGWTSSNRSSFILKIKDDMLEMHIKTGRNPFTHEINTAVGLLLREYEEKYGEKIEMYERQNRYRFCYTEGMSGRQDTYIETDNGDGFPVRKHLLHMSCFGKVEWLKCYIYDFLDLCVASDFLTIEDDYYTYNPETDANSNMEVKIIRPRITDQEKGWTEPYNHAAQVVYLRTVREGEEITNDSDPETQADDEGDDNG